MNDMQFAETGTGLSERMRARAAAATQAMLTRVLKNNLTALESLRASIERAQRKSMDDVREFGDTMGSAMLLGVEETVSYDDLLDLIAEMEMGLAKRAVAALV